jgi:hypothetical protein
MSSELKVALVPPFTQETAILKVRKAEDGWNSRNPEQVALAYTLDSKWRNRSEFVTGREQIVQFLTRKWQKELTIGSSKSSGRLEARASQSVSRTSRMTQPGSGSALTEMKTGSSTTAGLCITATPVLTTFLLKRTSASFIGRWAGVQTTTRASRN